jgi:antitoxin component of MazEF toxin-antitoxin module
MTRKVFQAGSSLAVTLPPSARKTLGLNLGDEVEVVVDSQKKSISINPVRKTQVKRREKITALALNFVERYREDLEALA